MLLTIGMIVKNEEKFLPDTLDSLKPLLENIESELIIADTGSTDNTPDIVKKYTDNYFEIEWRNDFAWARNQVLNRAKGQWHLQIDADEVLQNPEHIIKFFNSGEYKKYKTACLRLINKGQPVGYGDLSRLVKLEKGIQYEHKIHEALPRRLPEIKLESVLFHSGYDFTGEDGEKLRLSKIARNKEPILEMYRENPKDLRVISLLIDQYIVAQEFDNVIKTIENIVKTDPSLASYENGNKNLYLEAFVFRLTSVYHYIGEHEKLNEHVERFFNAQREAQITHWVMREKQGIELFKLKRYREAGEAFEKALEIAKLGLEGKLDTRIYDYASIPQVNAECLENLSKDIIISYAQSFEWDKIKNKIYSLLEEEKLKDAALLLRDYAGMNPTDTEILKIREKIKEML